MFVYLGRGVDAFLFWFVIRKERGDWLVIDETEIMPACKKIRCLAFTR